MRLKTACGCMRLSTGSIILGSLSIISSISLMIIMSIMMSQIDTKNISHDTLLLMKSTYRALMVYLPVVGISAALMIFGSIRRKSEYVFPWLALAYSGIVTAISSYMAFIVHVASMPILGFFVAILILAIAAALQIYFWLIVYSLYKDLLDEEYGYQADPRPKALI